MKKTIILFLVSFIVIGIGWAQEPTTPYVERMLFVKDGDNAVKVTYNGQSWADFNTTAANQSWKWYSYEEYAEQMKVIKSAKRSLAAGTDCDTCNLGILAQIIGESMLGAERDPAKLDQTLADIKNGIKVSRPVTIITKNGAGGINDDTIGWVKWYCYNYTFKDRAGKTVDLGLFETRGELFSALRQYYDRETAAGRLTKSEADRLYNNIAHDVRNVDEVPLTEKLVVYRQLYNPASVQ